MGDSELYFHDPITSENPLNSGLFSHTKGTFRRARWEERAVCDAGENHVCTLQFRRHIHILTYNCAGNPLQPQRD
jgi:hypothetical protein